MEEKTLRTLLNALASREIKVEEALSQLRQLPFTEINEAKIDTHRSLRTGMPEVIFCSGKTTAQVLDIIAEQIARDETVYGTRASETLLQKVKESYPGISVDTTAHCFWRRSSVWECKSDTRGTVLIVTGGTADMPVAQEALRTVEILGHPGKLVADVGVAGIHRLLASLPALYDASVIIAVAGMEGALPSVVSGMVGCPVIGVPTDVGYGTHLNGLAPLFAMLNSCASGLTVVNINNGFGAAVAAVSMNRK
jgi:hypothetical protein